MSIKPEDIQREERNKELLREALIKIERFLYEREFGTTSEADKAIESLREINNRLAAEPNNDLRFMAVSATSFYIRCFLESISLDIDVEKWTTSLEFCARKLRSMVGPAV